MTKECPMPKPECLAESASTAIRASGFFSHSSLDIRHAALPVAILAGGLATRLRPITEKFPKSLVPVAGEPFLAHQLRLLRAQGVPRAVLCVGHLGEMIEREFGDGRQWGIELRYSFDGPKLLGTGGALRQA